MSFHELVQKYIFDPVSTGDRGTEIPHPVRPIELLPKAIKCNENSQNRSHKNKTVYLEYSKLDLGGSLGRRTAA
jgi:hypothetical protein